MLRSLCRLIVLILTVSLPAASAEEFTLRGRVLGPDGIPVGGAEVRLVIPPTEVELARLVLGGRTAPDPVSRAAADANGLFVLPVPRPMVAELHIEAPGYLPLRTDPLPLVESLDFPDAELTADAGLTVKVTGPDGTAFPGAVVVAAPRRQEGPRRLGFWNPGVRAGLADGEGTVKLPCGARETVNLAAGGLGQAPANLANRRAGKATLKLGAAPRVPILVRDAAGKGVAGAVVAVGRPPLPCAFTGPEGKALLPLAGEQPVTVADAALRRIDRSVGPPAGDNPQPVILTFPSSATVHGKAIDAVTRKPIAGALVGRAMENGPWAATDGQGLFSVSIPAGRAAVLRCVAAGYLGAGFTEVSPADTRGVTLALRPAAAVSGKVVDAKGQGLAGAVITSIPEMPGAGPRRAFVFGALADRNRAFSNAQGEFRLRGLDPEQVLTLNTRLAGFAPGSLRLEGLRPRETKSGVVVELKPGTSATGQVVDGEERPLAEATVSVRKALQGAAGPRMFINPFELAEEESSTTDQEGRFSIPDLGAGKYDLAIRRRGFAQKNLPGIEVAGDGSPTDIGRIVLEPGALLQGRVTDTAGQPIEGASVRVPPADRLAAAMDALNPGRENAATLADGWFSVEDLRAGDKVDLVVSRAGYSEQRLDGVEVPPPAPLEIQLRPASTISGTVVDPEEQPIPGASITALRSAGGARGGGMVFMARVVRPVGADDLGQFEIQDVEPGKITLTASATGYQQQSLPEVEVAAGENVEGLKFVLQPGAVVQGQVFAPDGSPAGGARVGPVRSTEGPLRGGGFEDSRTDGDGRYRLENLTPGPASIEANHDDHGRAVKDLEVKAGTTTLDLRFEGGYTVSGQVTDEGGAPVPDSWVELSPAGQPFNRQSARAGGDGNFRVEGVKNGDYTVEAFAKGFAAARDAATVKVNGAPVTGVAVTLKPGGAIVGTVTGLDPDAFSQVNIWVGSGARFGGGGMAQPDYKGNFRIDNLSPGRYQVNASLSNSGRQAKAEATLSADQAEIQVELQFGKGLTLSGRVLQAASPISGMTLWLNLTEGPGNFIGETDHEGRFSIEGLEEGVYTLQANHFQRGLSHRETVEVRSNRTITVNIPTGKVSARVVDAIDRAPVAGASAILASAEAGDPLPFGGSAALTNENGSFTLNNVGNGTYQLTVKKDGYATVSRTVMVQSGKDPVLEDIVLDPTEGLALRVQTSYGAFPESVRVAVIDGAGRPLTVVRRDTGENGSLRVGGVPPGTWELLIEAPGSAPAAIQAVAPGGPYALTLPPACRLQVAVKELAEAPVAAGLSLAGADGKLFRFLGWGAAVQTEVRFLTGQVLIENLPPGSWTATVRAADGRTWTGAVTATAGTPAALTL